MNINISKAATAVSRALCAAILSAALLIGGWYTALPADICVEGSAPSGGFAAAVLRPTGDGGCGYFVGAIPIKDAAAEQMARPMLIPGGEAFGIKIRSKGVMVVGVGEGTPAERVGIKQGDIITDVNGTSVSTNDEIRAAVNSRRDVAQIVVLRGDSELSFTLTPTMSEDGLKIGAWVRDSAAGIGTLTFVDPDTGMFGGLGHSVSDVTTGEIVPLSSGEICRADIYGATKSESGSAGELCGAMQPYSVIGELYSNTAVGVFGRLCEAPSGRAIPLAFRQEVKCGAATVLTTIDDRGVRGYSVEIEHINLLDLYGTKAMVIRITDDELLSATGGIVRGMSGSPIIQDGRLVGAITHVLVNDPQRGYAVFAETMIVDS